MIRQATAKDLAVLARMSNKLSLLEHEIDPLIRIMPVAQAKRNYAKKLHSRNARFFVAEENNKIVGFIYGTISPAPDYLLKHKTTGFLDSAFVEQAYRKQGIGKQLVTTLLAWFASRNTAFIHLTVLAKNVQSVAAWRKMGFDDYVIRMKRVEKN